MRISKIASAGAICAALQYTPLLSTLILGLLLAAAAVFLRWFVRQPSRARADVVRLIRALTGN